MLIVSDSMQYKGLCEDQLMVPKIEENMLNVSYSVEITLQGHLPWDEWYILGC